MRNHVHEVGGNAKPGIGVGCKGPAFSLLTQKHQGEPVVIIPPHP